MHDLGYLIRDARKQRRMTLEELSHKSGIPVSNLSNIETGKISPRWEKVERILAGLQITPLQLFIPKLYDGMLQDLITKPVYYDDVKASWWFHFQNHVIRTNR